MALIYFGGLIIIIPLYYLWEWWSEGTLSGGEAVALSAILLVILGQMCVFPSLRVALFLLLVGTALLPPFLATTLGKVADTKLKKERIDHYRQAISRDPMNISARLQLSKTLYAIGKLDEAIEEIEAAFQLSKLSFEDSQTLAEWKEQQRIRGTRNVFCRVCGKENEHGSVSCAKCGRPLARGAAADWARSGGPAAAVRAWALAVASVAAFLFFLALIPGLPPLNPIVVAVVGVLAWYGFYGFSRRWRR